MTRAAIPPISSRPRLEITNLRGRRRGCDPLPVFTGLSSPQDGLAERSSLTVTIASTAPSAGIVNEAHRLTVSGSRRRESGRRSSRRSRRRGAGARPAPAPPPLLIGSRARGCQLAPGLATASVIILPPEPVRAAARCEAEVSDAHACSNHMQPALTPVLTPARRGPTATRSSTCTAASHLEHRVNKAIPDLTRHTGTSVLNRATPTSRDDAHTANPLGKRTE